MITADDIRTMHHFIDEMEDYIVELEDSGSDYFWGTPEKDIAEVQALRARMVRCVEYLTNNSSSIPIHHERAVWQLVGEVIAVMFPFWKDKYREVYEEIHHAA